MSFDSDIISTLAGTVLVFAIEATVVGVVLFLIHFLLTLPMRRAERARQFLDLIETAHETGQSVEETLISVAKSRDLSLGVRFYLVTAWLEQNLRLSGALAKVPRFLPPQITAMLQAGQRIGDLKKVLPACRQLLKDSVSQVRGAISYLVILTLVITPTGMWVFGVLQILVIPKFLEISEGFAGDAQSVLFLYQHQREVFIIQGIVLLSLWALALIYVGGPRFAAWFPILQRIHYRLPWRRKRMQRDFSTMLAILLDSGVPEPEAITLAADCSANKVFRKHAGRVVEALQQGRTLTQAVQVMDDSGEFGWRLANAFHGKAGFLRALAGWHESLDAKAFQQEQAAAHVLTSALVLWSGLFVGAVLISVFMFLISIINTGVLW